MKTPLNSKFLACLLTMLAAVIFTVTADATVISPGPGSFPPDIFALGTGVSTPTLLGLTTDSFVGSAGTLSGTIQAAVYSDPLNTFGAGDLDFVYQITNSASSTDSISRVTAINFTGFSTDVGFTATGSGLSNGFVNGTVAPELVDRQSGDVVGFTFNAPLTDTITPGATSTVLVIETNATQFTSGHVSVIDGSVTTVPAFSPTAVPEMSTVTLLGLGLVCLGGVALTRKKLRIADRELRN